MASTNVELVRSIYAAWDRGDFRSVEWAHPEIEYALVGLPDVSGNWKGVAEMTEAWRRWLTSWEDFRTEGEEYRELDDERVLVLAHWTGRGKTSGMELGQMRTRAATLFHVRENRVTRIVGYFDREDAFADLGLPPATRTPDS
jgi:ketosteroid isomerase-like protein